MGLFDFSRKKQLVKCENCGSEVSRDQLMLCGGKRCCANCYERVAKEQEKKATLNRPGVAKTYTERRNGFVHQYSVYHFTCARCGRTVECRSDDRPRRYEDYQGKRYCRACWEEMEKTITTPCVRCGKPISLYERGHSGRAGHCEACWLLNMREKRDMFGQYDAMLTGYLAGRGIAARGTDTDRLNEAGQPDGYRAGEERDHGLIRLRQNEYAIGAFRCRGGWFAIPERGSLLRYLKPSPDGALMERLASIQGTILAAATAGDDVFILTEKGMIASTDAGVDGARLFAPAERIGEMAARYFTEDEIEARVRRFMDGSIQPIPAGMATYYDTKAKVFFTVLADGNYYHGYDVSYPVRSKEAVLVWMTRFASVIGEEAGCRRGEIPMIEIVRRLEEVPNAHYQPPENFGYGVHFM